MKMTSLTFGYQMKTPLRKRHLIKRLRVKRPIKKRPPDFLASRIISLLIFTTKKDKYGGQLGKKYFELVLLVTFVNFVTLVTFSLQQNKTDFKVSLGKFGRYCYKIYMLDVLDQ